MAKLVDAIGGAVASIMIVDDDRDIRNSLQEIFEDEGYAVSSAADGAAALTRLRGGPLPQLILLDLMMPVMDGFAFCEQWQKDPALSAIPVIVVSADSTGRQRAEACGATGFLDKPIVLTDLLRVVHSYVGR